MYNITLETFDLKSGELLRSELCGLFTYNEAIKKLEDECFTRLTNDEFRRCVNHHDDINFTRLGISTYTNAKININTY